jgi:hypothetical protein
MIFFFVFTRTPDCFFHLPIASRKYANYNKKPMPHGSRSSPYNNLFHQLGRSVIVQ